MNLGERMKRYEHAFRRVLPKRTYTLVRVDGKAFHSFTKHMNRPFDEDLMLAMDTTMQYMCENMTGVQFAYCQSDEISLLMTDFANYETEPWMGGVEAKVLSLSASLATARFNRFWGALAFFDSRVWTMTDPNEVVNYFVWRQRDAVKNSITMAAQTVYSHGELDGKNGNERQDMLFAKGINWNDYPTGCKRGRMCVRVNGKWKVQPAVHFDIESLSDIVPKFSSME